MTNGRDLWTGRAAMLFLHTLIRILVPHTFALRGSAALQCCTRRGGHETTLQKTLKPLIPVVPLSDEAFLPFLNRADSLLQSLHDA